ncbi:MAG: ATP-grasp domain-containing protein [Faecalibacterium sp.]|jgi:RimK family alpha-L-glutamate ligase|nr:ATP-grasp domain-containing protein [Faecalibacterium sp.]
MQAWLLYDATEVERNRRYIGFYFEECEKRGISLTLLTAQELTPACGPQGLSILQNGQRLAPPDFVVFRAVAPVLQKQLERMGVPVYNSAAVSDVCNNKMLTYQLARSLGLTTMETRFISTQAAQPGLPYPLVVKPVDGKGGRGVCLVRDDAEFRAAATALGQPYCLVQQEANMPGRDVRVYVIGHTIRAAMLRRSDKDFRSNFCLGGQASVYPLSPKETQMVQKLADAMDFGFVGIDFVFHNGQMVFNEIEDVVGARMLYIYTDLNIVGEYLDWILTRIRRESILL